MKTISKAILTTALLVGSNATMAMSLNDFTIDANAYKSILSSDLTFTADKITGNYVEVATFNLDGTFDISIKWNAGQFVANDGNDALSVAATGLGLDYGLYALFQASGTYSTTAGVTDFNFLPSGSLALWIDDNVDTNFTAAVDGSSAWTTTSDSDDVLIATGSVSTGSGLLDTTLSTCDTSGTGTLNCGSFGTTNDFALEDPMGTSFFIAPTPFYNTQFDAGQLNSFTPTGTQTINGSMDVTFGNTVPEPTSLGLIGLGLIGLGFKGRKKA